MAKKAKKQTKVKRSVPPPKPPVVELGTVVQRRGRSNNTTGVRRTLLEANRHRTAMAPAKGSRESENKMRKTAKKERTADRSVRPPEPPTVKLRTVAQCPGTPKNRRGIHNKK